MNQEQESNKEENESNEAEGSSSGSDLVTDYGQALVKSRRGNIHCVTIVGQIEGHMVLGGQNKTTKYEHLLPQLALMEQDEKTDGILFLLNTVGGDVEAGLAIAEMIAGMSKPTVSMVLGGGHSIGVPLAVSADYSFISPTATMTVHPIRMNGLVIGVIQTFEYFDKMQRRISRFVEENSKMKAEDFKKLMLKTGEMANDVGTILFGEEAVECGLIDACGGIQDAYEKLYSLIEKKREKEKEKTDKAQKPKPQKQKK